jgi:hypothetical protein
MCPGRGKSAGEFTFSYNAYCPVSVFLYLKFDKIDLCISQILVVLIAMISSRSKALPHASQDHSGKDAMGLELVQKNGQVGFYTLFAQALKSQVENKGGDAAQVIGVLGGSCSAEQIKGGLTVTATQLGAALNAISQSLGDEHVGLRIGMGMTPSSLGSLGYAAMTAPNGFDAHLLYEELQQLFMTDIAMWHHVTGGLVQIQVEGGLRFLPNDYPFWAFLLALRLNFIRGACGQHVVPDRVALPCPPPRCDKALRAFVGAPVQFRASTYSECFQTSLLREPNPQSSPKIHGVMTTMARREWRELFDVDGLLISRLKRCILGALDKGANPTLSSLAPTVVPSSHDGGQAIGARQLQRRLAAHQHSFRDLVAEVRRERALAQLRSTNRPLADIAAEAGYAELSSFHRAVRRWTGLTPKRIRNEGFALNVDCV